MKRAALVPSPWPGDSPYQVALHVHFRRRRHRAKWEVQNATDGAWAVDFRRRPWPLGRWHPDLVGWIHLPSGRWELRSRPRAVHACRERSARVALRAADGTRARSSAPTSTAETSTARSARAESLRGLEGGRWTCPACPRREDWNIDATGLAHIAADLVGPRASSIGRRSSLAIDDLAIVSAKAIGIDLHRILLQEVLGVVLEKGKAEIESGGSERPHLCRDGLHLVPAVGPVARKVSLGVLAGRGLT